MRRAAFGLAFFAWSFLGAFGQQLEFGGWLGAPPASLGPALHLVLPEGDWRFDVYMRALWPRTDETNLGLGVTRAFEAGPVGRAELGFRGHLGLDAQYWVEGRAAFALARAAFSFRAGYTQNRTPSHFWPFERDSLGPYLDVGARFRLARRLLLLGAYRYQDRINRGELALSWIEGGRTFTAGAGAYRRPTEAYALLGLKAPVERAVVSGTVRIGSVNEFRLDYANPAYKAHLLLGYPPRAVVGVSWDAWALDAGVGPLGFELFLRYRAVF